MNQCSSTEELQNIKYRKQLKKFSLEFKQGDLREFYHLLFEQCSQKLFNTTMIFKFLIMITFLLGEIIYFENEVITAFCIVCLVLFILLWVVGFKIRHAVHTTFRICNLLISMTMYIIVMQISDGKIEEYSNENGMNCKQNEDNHINYTLHNSKLSSFFAVLFSLYQIIYIQIEIKWFFKAFHFFFIILLNWVILGVNSYAISYGVIYFTFIVILLYQLEITKKEGSFQMYRVIEDFQSLKTLINDILPMQIFIVQRNSSFHKPSLLELQTQHKNEIHNQNYGNQTNQNSQIHFDEIINLKQEEGIQKQEQVRKRQISQAEKDSQGIHGISTAFASNKKTIDLKSYQNENNSSQKIKDIGQSNNIKNNINGPINHLKQKTSINQQTNNIVIINDPTHMQTEQSNQSFKTIQQIKSAQAQQFSIEEAKPKTKRESLIQLQTLENDVNIYTEQQETNPPLIMNKNDLFLPSTRVSNQQSGGNCSRQQYYTEPLKVKYANKLIHQDFQSSNLEDILNKLNNIQLPINQKINNQSSAHTPTQRRQNFHNKPQTENLHDVLISKLYNMSTTLLMGGVQFNQQNQGSGIQHGASIYNQNQNNYLSNYNKDIYQQANTPHRTQNNYIEENDFQTEQINVQHQNIIPKSPFSQKNNFQRINGGFQDAVQKTLRLQATNTIGTGMTLENEQNFVNNNILDKNIQKSNFNVQTTNNLHDNQAWSTHRFGIEKNQINCNGILSESMNANIPNESAVFNSNQNYQQMGQHILNQQQYFQSIQRNQNHLNNDNLNIYNYVPQNKINRVWEYLNCMYKRNQSNINMNQSNNNGNSSNSRRLNTEQGVINQQEDDKNYDIKLVECKWEGEESIMVIMNNINERLMRERLLQIEQYKDTVIDTISHNLKTPLNCILAPLESIKLMLQQQYQQQQEEQNNFDLQIKRNSNTDSIKNKNKSSNNDAISKTFKNQLSTTGEIVEQVSMAINNCQLLLYMINDMIDYSEIIKGYYSFRLNVDYFKITYIIRVLNNLFLDQMQSKKIEFKITTRIDLSEQILLHDSRRLLQILVNLISNSLKFTLKGKIELIIDNPNDEFTHNSIFSVQQQSLSNKYLNSPSSSINKQQFKINDGKSTNTHKQNLLKLNEISNSNHQPITNYTLDKKKHNLKEKHIRFTIIDSGIGMQHSKLLKLKRMLFKKERQNTSNSSGLGLTMCYSLIKQIGCGHTHLDILSEENIGSSFSFTIQQFYKNSQYPNCTPTNTNFQSTNHLQKQNNPIQLTNGLNIKTNVPQLQHQIVSEIKEESSQSRLSPIFHIEKVNDELNNNIPTFQALQAQQMSTLLLNIPQNSSVALVNNPNQNSNFSNLHSKTILENKNILPKVINTIGKDEQILDSSSEGQDIVDIQDKFKTIKSSKQAKLNNNQNNLVQLNFKNSNQANNNFNANEQGKEQKYRIEKIQQNATNASQLIKGNEDLNHLGNSNMQNKNLQSTSFNKNIKQQKIGFGPSSLSQFSMVSLGTGRAEQKRKGRKKNLNQLNTCYSSITQRHTMIFGKNLKSEAFDNDDFEDEYEDDDWRYEESNFSEGNQDNQEDYYNSNDSMRIQLSSEKKRKKQAYKSNQISANNLDDQDDRNTIENSNKKIIELQQLQKNEKGTINNPSPKQEKENGKNKMQFQILNPCSEEINSNLSNLDESHEYISENKDQIITQKYQSNTIASRNFDSNIFNTATNIILDKAVQSGHQSLELNHNNFFDNAIQRKDEMLSNQSQSNYFNASKDISYFLNYFIINLTINNQYLQNLQYQVSQYFYLYYLIYQLIEIKYLKILFYFLFFYLNYNKNNFIKVDSNMLIPHINTEKDIQQTIEMIFDSKNILVVDDTIYNIVSMKIFFRNVNNLKIEEAYNGRDALEKYQENAINGKYFDYIFMDIEMPIMDGLECIKNIREFEIANNLRRTTIITVTAYERELQEVKQAGANALIAKPIQKDKFLQVLRYLQGQNQ